MLELELELLCVIMSYVKNLDNKKERKKDEVQVVMLLNGCICCLWNGLMLEEICGNQEI